MNDLQSVIATIFNTPGAPLEIGAMIGTAMLIGFIVYDNTPNMFYRILVIFGAFFIFAEWIRRTIVDSITPSTHPSSAVFWVGALIGALFLTGLLVGMAFAHQYRKKLKKTEEAADEVIEKIRNGDFGNNSRINQITKPITKEQ